MMPHNSEFFSITDDRTDDTYGTRRTDNAAASESDRQFDNLQLIFNCDTLDDSNPQRNTASSDAVTGATNPNLPSQFQSSNVTPSLLQSSGSSSDPSSYHHQPQSQDEQELPICQSYSDLDQSIDDRSPKRSRFLSWFSRRFILPDSNGSGGDNSDGFNRIQSSLQSPETLWSLNYREAAIYLEEGYNNDKFENHPQEFWRLPAYLIVHNHLYYLIDLFACLLVLSLAIFERPAVDGLRLPELIHSSVELFGLSVITVIFWIKFQWMNYRYFFSHKRTLIKSLVLALMIVEAFVVLIRRDSHFRITRSLRPVFLIDNYYFGGVRRVIRQTIQSLRSYLEMLLLLLFFLVFFSISAFYLFSSMPNYEQFSTIWNSFVSLFVLLTTSNYPDVMMPAYRQGQPYVLFFIFFLAVNLYFLLNIMLAVVYNTFSQIEKDKFRKLFLHRRVACEHAFRLLVTPVHVDYIKFPHFCGLMDHLKPNTSLLERYLMFKALVKGDFPMDERNKSVSTSPAHSSCGHYLTLHRFYNIYEVMHLRWRNETVSLPWFHKVVCLTAIRPALNRLHWAVKHRFFTYFTYTIIVLATAYQMMDTIFGHQWWQESVGLSNSAPVVAFILLYTIEMCLKLLGLGVHEYFHHRWNCFDFLITVVALTTFLLTQYQVTWSLSTSFFSFRALRLIELLRFSVARYREILGPFAYIIIKRFASVTLVVLIIYYFFAIVAMEFFGAYDMRDCCRNTTIQAYYETTGQNDLYYYLNNFNDLISSFITLFELMMVNNWPVIMKSYVIITGTKVTSLFFMVFFLVSLLVIAIVLSFVIDTIQFQMQYQDRFGQDNMSAKIQVKVRLSRDEVHQISQLDSLLATGQSNSIAAGPTTGSLSGYARHLLSSPFPPSWSLLRLIFQGQNFERMRTFHSSVNLMEYNNSAGTTSFNPASINVSTDEFVANTDHNSTLFRGTRFRDKFSYNLRMYSDEIQKWIQ